MTIDPCPQCVDEAFQQGADSLDVKIEALEETISALNDEIEACFETIAGCDGEIERLRVQVADLRIRLAASEELRRAT